MIVHRATEASVAHTPQGELVNADDLHRLSDSGLESYHTLLARHQKTLRELEELRAQFNVSLNDWASDQERQLNMRREVESDRDHWLKAFQEQSARVQQLLTEAIDRDRVYDLLKEATRRFRRGVELRAKALLGMLVYDGTCDLAMCATCAAEIHQLATRDPDTSDVDTAVVAWSPTTGEPVI